MAQEYRRKATLRQVLRQAQGAAQDTASVSLINYVQPPVAFVWCSRYRREVPDGPVQERLGALVREALAELDCEVLALEVMVDHVHLFVNCPPTLAPCQIVFCVKGRASRVLRQEFPELRRLPSLWTRSYPSTGLRTGFVGTAGNVPSTGPSSGSGQGSGRRIETQNQRERA
jgi:putative transposase